MGILTDTHPRLNGDLIPTPEDILEGRGDFVHEDANGNFEGLKIVRVEHPDGWDVLVGESANETRRQNSSPLLITRPSFVNDHAFVNGPPAPSSNDPLLAKIPQPQTPLLKVVKAAVHGFPATTAQKPMWYGYAWVKNGNLTLLSPRVPFQVAQGQGLKVVWADPPSGVEGVALFLSEPGTSSATNSGPMREQERLLFTQYQLSTRELTGPYRMGRLAPVTNEATLPAPTPPPDTEVRNSYVTLEPGGYVADGDYHFYIGVASSGGETVPTLVYHVTVPDDLL